jgi:hypothetical protein
MIISYDFGLSSRRYPTGHYWDKHEPKLLACETRKIRGRMLASNEKRRKLSSMSTTISGISVVLLRKYRHKLHLHTT